MKKSLFIMAYLFLMVNSQVVAMDDSCCSCNDNDTTAGTTRQKVAWDANDQAQVYQYNQVSNRWKLVRINRPNPNKKSDFIFRHYLKKNDQIEVYEVENQVGDLKLVETLTIEQHNELDLKEDGQFVVGLDKTKME